MPDDDPERRREARMLARLDDGVVGSRISRVARRPHEVRVFLRGERPGSVWLHFWPARDAVVDLKAPDAEIRRVTVDEADGRCTVRLWSADGRVVLDASAPQWSFHPYEPATEGGLWLLTEDEKAAVHRAVEAVVVRDAATVATMLGDPDDVGQFWTWVDEHWPGESGTWTPARLLMPPPPIEDWERDAVRDGPDVAYVVVDFLDADDPERPTDLSLELTVRRGPDGSVRVEVEPPHVM